jgi:hypothetical protein
MWAWRDIGLRGVVGLGFTYTFRGMDPAGMTRVARDLLSVDYAGKSRRFAARHPVPGSGGIADWRTP